MSLLRHFKKLLHMLMASNINCIGENMGRYPS